jgi:hypothetical protein
MGKPVIAARLNSLVHAFSGLKDVTIAASAITNASPRIMSSSPTRWLTAKTAATTLTSYSRV